MLLPIWLSLAVAAAVAVHQAADQPVVAGRVVL
jgi:hypothetical protein